MALKPRNNYFFLKIAYVFFLSLFILTSCSDNKPTEPDDDDNTTPGVISTGEVTQEISEDVGSGGGTVVVSNSESKINGLTITVPANGYGETRNFSISSAPIKNHSLGTNFNPISPMISIKNGGGYSEGPMTIKIPIQKATDEFAVGFFYNEITGEIEILPAIDLDETSITVETRHFALSGISSESNFGKVNANGIIANLVISSIKESVLSAQTVLSSGFTPGVDDWEFVNYGSYVADGGHCAGQSMTAMWYYYEKKLNGEQGLFHLFDKVNESGSPGLLWQDNPLGYRFASTIQEDFDWDGWVKNVNLQARYPKLTYNTFIAAMLITGEPQFVIIKESATNAGHAMIIYKINVTEGKLYVADPNYPNNRGIDGNISVRTIPYSNEKLGPYPSFQKVGDPGTIYDQIAIFGKTANIEWSKITDRYKEFEAETIGSDRFPNYSLTTITSTGTEPLVDGMTVTEDTLKFYCRNSNIPASLPGTDKLQKVYIYSDAGAFITQADNNGLTKVKLVSGENKLGVYVCGYKNNISYNYYDFNWFTIKYQNPNAGDDKILESNRCYVRVRFDGHYKHVDQDGKTTEIDQEDNWGTVVDLAIGSFSGNTFTGSYDKTLGSSNYKGTVVVTLNDDYNLVTSVDWSEDYTSFSQNNVDATSTSSFSGHDIPLSSVIPANFQDFQIVEEQTCSRIDLLEYSYQNQSNLNQTLESHTCNKFSYIQVSFSEE